MAFAGLVLLRIASDDAYLRYVRASMQRWLVVAGVLLIVIGVASWASGRQRSEEDPGADGHTHRGPASAWLLLLPLLAVLFVAPPALGTYAADHLAIAPQPSEASGRLPAGDPAALPLYDFVSRAVWEDGKDLPGRRVRLVGFTVPAAGGGWNLARLHITCCAADAYASTVHPVDDVHTFAPGTWVEVVGVWSAGGLTRTDVAVPDIAVKSVEVVDPPRETYE